MTDIQSRKSGLAKLLAAENIDVQHRQVKTATFDPASRVLTLPIWKGMSEDVYDLLVGHEVGHALWSPNALGDLIAKHGAGFKPFINVIEDLRIERKIKDKFQGLKAPFARGYQELWDNDFWSLKESGVKDANELHSIDKVHIYGKAGPLTGITLDASDKALYDRTQAVETFEEAVELALELYNQHKNQDEQQQQEEESGEGDSGEAGEESNQGSEGSGSGQDSGEGEEKEGNESSASGDESGESEESGEGSGESGEGEDDESGEGSGSSEAGDSDESGEESASGSSDDSGDSEEESSDASGSGQDSGDAESEAEASGESEAEAADNADYDSEKTGGSKSSAPAPAPMGTDAIENSIGDKFVDESAKDIVYTSISEYKDVTKLIEPNADVFAKLKNHYGEEGTKEFNAFVKRAKPIVAHMVKEFSLRRSADQHKRTATAKSGVLNTNKLYNYKISEDIFKRNETVRDGTNHGFVVVLDWSSSMDGRLVETAEQLMILAMFFKRVNVPFEVYAFTNNGSAVGGIPSNLKTVKAEEGKEYYITPKGTLSLINFLSSKGKTAQFNASLRYFYCVALSNGSGYSRISRCPHEYQTWGTPLHEAIIASKAVVKNFQKATGVEKTNIIFMTDGEGSRLPMRDQHGDATRAGVNNSAIGKLKVGNKVYGQVSGYGLNQQSTLFHWLKEETGATLVGFYLVDSIREAHAYITNYDQANSDMKEKGFAVSDTDSGYDEYYIIKAEKVGAFKKSSSANATAQFKKRANEKKKNRQLAGHFITRVA